MAFASSAAVPIRSALISRSHCGNRNVAYFARNTRVTMALPAVLHDRVLVKIDEKVSETASGLVLPIATDKKEKTGVVINVGPGRFSPAGALEPMPVSVGDCVAWKDDFGSETVEVDGETLLALRVPSIVAKWKRS